MSIWSARSRVNLSSQCSYPVNTMIASDMLETEALWSVTEDHRSRVFSVKFMLKRTRDWITIQQNHRAPENQRKHRKCNGLKDYPLRWCSELLSSASYFMPVSEFCSGVVFATPSQLCHSDFAISSPLPTYVFPYSDALYLSAPSFIQPRHR